jgi:hypothetical protein
MGVTKPERTFHVTKAGIAAYQNEEQAKGITNETAKSQRSHPQGEGSPHLAASA